MRKKFALRSAPPATLSTLSLADELPEDLQIDDLLYAENIGAYTIASTTYFNGFPPPKVVHLNK